MELRELWSGVANVLRAFDFCFCSPGDFRGFPLAVCKVSQFGRTPITRHRAATERTCLLCHSWENPRTGEDSEERDEGSCS